MPRGARQHAWRTRHGARGGIRSVRQALWFAQAAPRPGHAGGCHRVRRAPVPATFMQALLVSVAAVAVAEIGDKTQLLSLILAAKYRRPWPICLGILVATLLNHAIAGAAGALVAQWFSPDALR